MDEQKMRERFEADMWRDALEEGAEPNLTRGPNGGYVQPWISGAWHGYQAATAATQRDAMAVADAVRLACKGCECADGERFIERLDLAAIVEAVRPGNREPVCGTCNGRGEVGGHVGQTPENFDYVSEPCPDCQQPTNAQQQGEPVVVPLMPKYDCFSRDDGDSWEEHPASDCFVHGRKLGDEFELLAGWKAERVMFRVTKAPDDESDDYEVEQVTPNPSALPAPACSVPDVSDEMALAFHRALTDAAIGSDELEEIKTGLRAAMLAAAQKGGA